MPSGVTKAKAVSRGHCCAAYNCSERQKKRSVLNNFDRDADLSFHRFPLNKPDLLALWVRALRRNGFKPTKSSLICSKHFREDDFHQGEKRRKLKSNAVPTIFDFPAHLQKAPTPSRRPIIKHPLTVRKRHSKLFKIKIDVANIFKDHTDTVRSKDGNCGYLSSMLALASTEPQKQETKSAHSSSTEQEKSGITFWHTKLTRSLRDVFFNKKVNMS
ncbi:hypothetical protein RRG08_037874 [Elysia crispata]|uniref:THAP-type domain-containing protein n=1 Tax=Elysia crispata TaxID=231223 RepID=A0AAE0ZLK2_9GAST|nr:hypothetical protein RRG08_037874 [Elysia crispata]